MCARAPLLRRGKNAAADNVETVPARFLRDHAAGAPHFALAAMQPGLSSIAAPGGRCSLFGSDSALYATPPALDSVFTAPGFLRKMAFSHAAPSPENRCFVRLGLV